MHAKHKKNTLNLATLKEYWISWIIPNQMGLSQSELWFCIQIWVIFLGDFQVFKNTTQMFSSILCFSSSPCDLHTLSSFECENFDTLFSYFHVFDTLFFVFSCFWHPKWGTHVSRLPVRKDTLLTCFYYRSWCTCLNSSDPPAF